MTDSGSLMPGRGSSELERFVRAQDSGATYDAALAELHHGRKRTHWMWFVFPQLDGLGRSAMAKKYAIRDAAQARDYLAHPVLGPRLVECASAALGCGAASAAALMGSPDDVKLRSSMTLFASLDDADPVFARVLEHYYAGPDADTLLLLAGPHRPAQ